MGALTSTAPRAGEVGGGTKGTADWPRVGGGAEPGSRPQGAGPRRFRIADGKLVEANGAADASVLVYAHPTDAERADLVNTFKIDEHTLASSLDPDELSRVELEPDHMAVILKRPTNYSSRDQLLFRVSSFGLFLFKDRLIVVLSEEASLFEGKQTATSTPFMTSRSGRSTATSSTSTNISGRSRWSPTRSNSRSPGPRRTATCSSSSRSRRALSTT